MTIGSLRASWCVGPATAAWLVMMPALALAQEPEKQHSGMFRRGQLAAEFYLPGRGTLINLGVLVFTSGARAWLLNVALRASAGEDSAGDATAVAFSGGALQVRIGRRSYAFPTSSAATLRTLGLTAGVSNPTVGGLPRRQEGPAWNLGAFGELGAALMFGGRLSLGMTARIRGTYAHQVAKAEGARAVVREWSLVAERLSATLTLYF